MKETEKKKGDNFHLFYALSIAAQLGFFIIVPMAISIFFGIWLDNYFQTKPILLLISIFFGIIITGYEVFNILKPIIKNNENKEK